MNADEKGKLLADLERGKQALLDCLAGLTEQAAARKLAPGKWSILECVEHLAISEDYLFMQIEASHDADTQTISRSRESLILERGLDRTRTVESPDVGKPNGRFSTLTDAVQRFLTIRERTVRFVEGCDEDLRCKITSHPIIGTVNCYETLLMIAVHPLRHAKQIEETKAELCHRRNLSG